MKRSETLVAAAVVAVAASIAWAGDCCQRCGCDCQPRKVCRLTCEEKETPCVTYSCQCEDFCVPGPSQKCGCTCEVGCDGCQKCQPNYLPTCAKAHTKKKLYKHVEMKKEKVYKWVVEYVCDHCAENCEDCASADPDCSAQQQSTVVERVASRPTSPNFLGSLFGAKSSRE